MPFRLTLSSIELVMNWQRPFHIGKLFEVRQRSLLSLIRQIIPVLCLFVHHVYLFLCPPHATSLVMIGEKRRRRIRSKTLRNANGGLLDDSLIIRHTVPTRLEINHLLLLRVIIWQCAGSFGTCCVLSFRSRCGLRGKLIT